METLTYKQIKSKVKEAWALIYNPVYSPKTGKLVKGELIRSDTNRKVLIEYIDKEKQKNLHFAILWFGSISEEGSLLNFF